MKNLLKLTVILLLTSYLELLTVQAQTPNQFKYQAVLRDASGTIISDQAVTVNINILKGSAAGTSVFTEQHNVTTTAQGLINLNIGSVSDLSVVNFLNDTYFIEISINGTVMGTSQLMSVPYALTAKNVENDQVGDGSETHVTAGANVIVTGTGTSGDPYVVNATTAGSPIHYVGELYGGGIVYWVDDTGTHGLIASLDDLDGGNGVAWSANAGTGIGATAQSFYDGASNTAAIVALDNTPGYAATLCVSYTGGGYSDWYLPSHQELQYLRNSSLIINQILANDGDSSTNGLNISNSSPYGYYWSSTEYISNTAWHLRLQFGDLGNNLKTDNYRVRAVRAF